MRPPASDDRPDPESLRHRVTELSNLYEVSRALLGARDQTQVAFRSVLSGMNALGVRSGALFMSEERGRFQLLYTSLVEPELSEAVTVPATAREWMLREGTFQLGAAAARALGTLRDRLVERYDAAVGVAVPDAQGLLAFMVFGPRLFPGEFDDTQLSLLDSMGVLTAQALGARPPRDASKARRRAVSRPARSMEMLRETYPPLQSMIGVSPALLETCQDLLAVARTHFPALLAGESGVGKELAAKAIHELSDRATGPFEVVDCGSIPRELIESELFGHVRGAFTGAHRDRRGAFELAHRGTLFLDEIGEMPLQLQTRLLRVLQEGRFRRVGDERVIEVEVRVVAATNRDLRAEVLAKRFREDLYYRLNVFAVRVPPLRERVQDIGPLVHYFLHRQRTQLGSRELEVQDDVIKALETYALPGNVRELANLCAALGVRARDRGEISLEELDQVWRRQHGNEEPPWHRESLEGQGNVGAWVLDQLRAARFNLVEASRLLRRQNRSGRKVPLTERSALAYYLTGEILRALVECEGDAEDAARRLAGDDDLVVRVLSRVGKVQDALRSTAGNPQATRVRFGKLPSGYEEVLARAGRLETSDRAAGARPRDLRVVVSRPRVDP